MKIKVRHGSPDGIVNTGDEPMEIRELENGHKKRKFKQGTCTVKKLFDVEIHGKPIFKSKMTQATNDKAVDTYTTLGLYSSSKKGKSAFDSLIKKQNKKIIEDFGWKKINEDVCFKTVKLKVGKDIRTYQCSIIAYYLDYLG